MHRAWCRAAARTRATAPPASAAALAGACPREAIPVLRARTPGSGRGRRQTAAFGRLDHRMLSIASEWNAAAEAAPRREAARRPRAAGRAGTRPYPDTSGSPRADGSFPAAGRPGVATGRPDTRCLRSRKPRCAPLRTGCRQAYRTKPDEKSPLSVATESGCGEDGRRRPPGVLNGFLTKAVERVTCLVRSRRRASGRSGPASRTSVSCPSPSWGTRQRNGCSAAP